MSHGLADAPFIERAYSTFRVRVMEREAFCALPVTSKVYMPGGVSLGFTGGALYLHPAAAATASSANENAAKRARLGGAGVNRESCALRRNMMQRRIASPQTQSKRMRKRLPGLSRRPNGTSAVAFGPPVVSVTVKFCAWPGVTAIVAGLMVHLIVCVLPEIIAGHASDTVPLNVASGVTDSVYVAVCPGATF